jgi:hypothetical protein
VLPRRAESLQNFVAGIHVFIAYCVREFAKRLEQAPRERTKQA